MTKKCSLCKDCLDLSCFYRDTKAKSGYSSACRRCRSRQISDAAKKRRVGLDVKKPDTRLWQKNASTLITYISEFVGGTALRAYIPTLRVGALQVCPHGAVLRKSESGTAWIEVYAIPEGGTLVLDKLRFETIVDIFTAKEIEVLSPP